MGVFYGVILIPHKDYYRGLHKINSVTIITGSLRIPDAARPDLSFLEAWRGNVGHRKADETLRKANEIGTAVHSAIEQYLITGEINEDKERFIRSFKDWVDKTGFKPTSLEPKEPLYTCADIYSQHKEDEACDKCFCGTYDAIGIVDGVNVISDWKTSSRMSITNGLQLAAYCKLYNSTVALDSHVNSGYIVRLDKKTFKCDVRKYENLTPYYEIFKGLIPASYYVRQQMQWAHA